MAAGSRIGDGYLSSPVFQLSSHGKGLWVRLEADFLLTYRMYVRNAERTLAVTYLVKALYRSLNLTRRGAMRLSLPLMEAKIVVLAVSCWTCSSLLTSLFEVVMTNSCADARRASFRNDFTC